ncbi:MAG: HAD family phosphatase [Firmicutes bacterium]|jgi:hypothetical protein|nr:HAD family phosphatase [Bacillota bacterium]
MSHYKLLVTDIDGTLVDSRQEIPEANRQAVQRLLATGALFTFATGRIEESTIPYARDLKINAPAILYNGAKIVDFERGETLFERSLPMDQAIAALEIASGFDVKTHVYIDGKVYVARIDSVVRDFARKDGVDCTETGDLVAFLKSGQTHVPPTKFLIIGESESLGTLRRRIHDVFPEGSLVKSDACYLELLPPGVSKGAALSVLCEILGLDPADTVAIGDNMNDVEMIQAAGIGVAVENAHPYAREQAAFVAPSNEECGVAAVIGRFFGI